MSSFRRVLWIVCTKSVILVLAWLCMAWLCVAPSRADAIVGDETVNKAMESVVVIYKPSTNEQWKPDGAGFFITKDGYLLTAYHVVAPNRNENKGTTFRLKVRSGSELYARLIGQNEYLDVALLKVVLPNGSPLWSEIKPLPLEADAVNSHLAILGHPIESDRPMLFDHIDVQVSDSNSNGLVAVSPAAEPGYSGGPVINDAGSAVAIAASQSSTAPITYVRSIDTLAEFLESNEFIPADGGYEQHLSLSNVATIEQVKTLQTQLDRLKEEERRKQNIIDDITKQLWNLKSQVQWSVSICEIPHPPKEIQAEPRHRLTIGYDKVTDIMFDAEGVFTARIVPLLVGEGESKNGLVEARNRKLYVGKSVTFVGQHWVFEQLDDDVKAQVQNYNETRDASVKELDTKNIDGFMVTLTPPRGDDEMQFFRFSDKVARFVDVKKCDVQQ